MNASMNGVTVRKQQDGTLCMRIPAELARKIEGGCSCEYCKAHPDQPPTWDTLCVHPDAPHSWTVHNPEGRY